MLFSFNGAFWGVGIMLTYQYQLKSSSHDCFTNLYRMMKIKWLNFHFLTAEFTSSEQNFFFLNTEWIQEAHRPWHSSWEPTWPFAKVPHTQYSLSNPWVKIELSFTLAAAGFWETGRFSKLPYLGMKLGHWPKCHKLRIYSLSTPGGQNWAYRYFCSTGSDFWDMGWFLKCHIWAWNLAIGQSATNCTYTS